MANGPRRPAPEPALSAAQYRVMAVLWSRGAGTVADVVAALRRPKLAYTTVLTVLRQLEAKGIVRHDQDGRTFVYEPLVTRDQVRSGVLRQITRSFFGGSPADLVLHMVQVEPLTPADRRRLRELLSEDD
jgi:BlaI family transcriptional regulator, penicillinase repressor